MTRTLIVIATLLLIPITVGGLNAGEADAPALPFDPQIISRLSLDGKPRSLAIRQGPDKWLGYDLERATVLKAWQAPAGKPGLLKSGFVTRSAGKSLFEDPGTATWELQRGGKTVPVDVRYLGCSQRKDHIELSWELQTDSGTLKLFERIPLAAAAANEGMVRELRVENLAAEESLLLPAAARTAWKLAIDQEDSKPALTGKEWHRLILP
ncbi:hypothetical protein NA78x_003295 [Anatilimnocola sp. NA78]|uniref:hypothetical protein n=1 Tax=Anatilimnocola sp. NA78 TaxID=3415683 RepID=UPI003CE4E08E